MTMRRNLHAAVRFAGVLAVLAASGAAGVVAPRAAHAAEATPSPTQIVQFSTDGIHWSDSYGAQLFRDVILVPGDASMRSFYVRNGATVAAILSVTLADVSTDSIPLADALSISTSTSGVPGATIPVSQAQPCVTLSRGLRLASGDSIRLDNTVSLGDLTGDAGQNGAVWFALRVSFSSVDAAAPAPNTCPVNYGTVDTFPNPATGSVRSSAAPVYHRTAAGWSSIPTSVGGAIIATTTTPTNVTPSGTASTPVTQILVSNTARFYQEYDVAFWLAMSVLGWVILILVRRRRAEQPEVPEHLDQIGAQR
jgi:hypothetical protein